GTHTPDLDHHERAVVGGGGDRVGRGGGRLQLGVGQRSPAAAEQQRRAQAQGGRRFPRRPGRGAGGLPRVLHHNGRAGGGDPQARNRLFRREHRLPQRRLDGQDGRDN